MTQRPRTPCHGNVAVTVCGFVMCSTFTHIHSPIISTLGHLPDPQPTQNDYTRSCDDIVKT